ncbi:MAG TPA: 4-alpha-glucanotransferase, partial [Candidatus Sulfotelmatobacter sp.]|nr:4-alpha-glucanotransferase [Candidatus Sulfotelmatobacter sp.]
MTSERSKRWGVVPAYYGWQGDLKETAAETEKAILDAMGAARDRPPRLRVRGLSPDPCEPAPRRTWGWSVQLYALRSESSWGVGDLADLRRFGRFSRRSGASAVLLNPLGAQNPTLPYEPSPYYASTRRFRNFVYLRMEEVEGAAAVEGELAPLRAAAHELNAEPLIDYDVVYGLKTRALEAIFRAAPTPAGLDGYVRRQGAALRDFALFSALCEVHGLAWRDWPADVRHPSASGLEAAREELAGRVAYHQWLQFHVDRQLARASREIGLIADVPVGFAS